MSRRRPTATNAMRAALVGALVLSACVGGAPTTRTPPPAEIAPPPRYSVSQPALLPDELTIALDARENGLFVATRIDGRPVGDFIIDTGANATIINEAVADAIALPVAVDVQVGGIHAETGS